MKIKVVGLDLALSNLGIAVAEIDLDDPMQYSLIDLHLEQTEDGKAVKLKRMPDGKLKKVKYMPKGQTVGSDDVRRARILSEALRQYTKDADIVFAEVPIGSQSARAMASYGISVGLIGSVAKPLVQVSPSDVKKAGCNDVTATKAEMIEAAVSMFPDAPWLRAKQKRKGEHPIIADNEHLADACFIIKAGMQTDEYLELIEKLKNSQSNLEAA